MAAVQKVKIAWLAGHKWYVAAKQHLINIMWLSDQWLPETMQTRSVSFKISLWLWDNVQQTMYVELDRVCACVCVSSHLHNYVLIWVCACVCVHVRMHDLNQPIAISWREAWHHENVDGQSMAELLWPLWYINHQEGEQRNYCFIAKTWVQYVCQILSLMEHSTVPLV